MRSKSFFGGLLSLILASALIAAFVLAFQEQQKNPKHQPLVSGSSICQEDGQYLVTWTVGNSQTGVGQDMTVASISRTVNGIVVGTNVPPAGSVQGTELVPGNISGIITLIVSGHWEYDGFNAIDQGSVTLGGTCVQPSETPTETEQPTSTNTPTETEEIPSETPTPTPTDTEIPPTDTSTPTETLTPQPTSTDTATITEAPPTETETSTPTKTTSPEVSPTSSNTPTVTETTSPEASSTASSTLGPSATPSITQPGPSQTPSQTQATSTATSNVSVTPTPPIEHGKVYLTLSFECQVNAVVKVKVDLGGKIIFHLNGHDLSQSGEILVTPGFYEWSVDYNHDDVMIGPGSQGVIDTTQICAATPVVTSTPNVGNPPPPSGGGIPLGLVFGSLLLLLLPVSVLLLLRRKKAAA